MPNVPACSHLSAGLSENLRRLLPCAKAGCQEPKRKSVRPLSAPRLFQIKASDSISLTFGEFRTDVEDPAQYPANSNCDLVMCLTCQAYLAFLIGRGNKLCACRNVCFAARHDAVRCCAVLSPCFANSKGLRSVQSQSRFSILTDRTAAQTQVGVSWRGALWWPVTCRFWRLRQWTLVRQTQIFPSFSGPAKHSALPLCPVRVFSP